MKSSWSEFFRFFTHAIFLLPFGILLAAELFLQTGVYRKVLKPTSYAASILRIRDVIKKSPVKPSAVIVGTSIPYQGILLDQLNAMTKEKPGWVFQSVAVQGAFLETQTVLLDWVLKEKKTIHTVIHFAEIDFPWQQSRKLEPSNRSMLAEFPVKETLSLLKNNHYRLDFEDYTFFYIKLVTYRNDLKDLLLHPLGRIKSLSRERKEFSSEYPYLNHTTFSISVYGSTIEECIEAASRGIPPGAVSDEPHRRAVLDTCRMGDVDISLTSGREDKEKLFTLRLENFYKVAKKNNLNVIVVIPPYSRLAPALRKPEKKAFWIQTLKNLDSKIPVLDLMHVLDDENHLEYFYDTIHLNRKGAEVFTRIFYESLLPYFNYIQSQY